MSAVLDEALLDAAATRHGTARSAASLCHHCALPVPPGSAWLATIDGVARRMCCPGCAAAAGALVDGSFPQLDAGDVDPLELARADALGAAGELGFTVEGLRCAACVWLIERRLLALPGVREVRLNLATERLFVHWDPTECRPSAILRALRAIGYTAYPYDAQRHGAQLERARVALLRRLIVAGLSLLQVLLYALPVPPAATGWIALYLTLPALLYAAQPFFAGAWHDLRRGMPGMDIPVALALGVAFADSCSALILGGGALHFDAVALFAFLLLGSRYLELGARRQAAGALDRLQQGMPASALRLRGHPLGRNWRHEVELVAAGSLQVDDMVLVRAGQAVPADGVIHEGETEVDLALLTGESRTQRRGVGDAVPGGAVNAAQAFVLRVTSSATDSTLAMLVRLVERAGHGKPALALWADRIAAWFVLGLLGLTAGVYLAWLQVDPDRAWQVAIAVLMVSCPCALSLATPTALAATTDRLLRRGVLAVRPHTLDTFDRATHVVFDKTGTLTLGRPVLRQTVAVGALDGAACLGIAAALEADNPHPLAQALRDAVAAPCVAEAIHFTPGLGVEGWIDGVRYRLGSAAWVAGIAGGAARAAAPAGTTSVWLGASAGWLARFDLFDALRPEAPEVVQRLRAAGKTVILLSGDAQHAAQSVAAQLGISTAIGDQLPHEKLACVRRLQAAGATVAMIGDGMDDAAVLGGADVSFAMGRGAELAQLHADGVLTGDDLMPLADALDCARRTLAVIRQNLIWAAVYNAVAIPAAASGLLDPWLAGVGVAGSSALVVMNALRLRDEH